jgi:hypothetical protein
MENILIFTALSFIISLPLGYVLKSNGDKRNKEKIRKIVLEIINEERAKRRKD